MGSLLTVFVTERYRVAAVPGLLLGASFGVWELWQNCVNAKYRSVAIYTALLLAATLFVSVPQTDPGLWALDAYNSGWQALQVKDYPLAGKKLELSYAYVPENAEINFALGNLRLAQGDTFRAKQYYAASLRLDSHHAGALNNLGLLAMREERWEVASKFFREAIEQEPDDAKTHYLLAEALLRMGERENARSEILKAIVLNPNQPEFLKLRDEIR
jgi:Flp pilus assembly protein TadD